MKNDNTFLVLAHGHIQTSPEHIQQLNHLPAQQFIPLRRNDDSHLAGYMVFLSGYAQYILKKESYTKEYVWLSALMNSLRSTPRPVDGYTLRNSVTVRSVSNDFYRVDYRIYSGQVEVFNIQTVDRLQKVRDRLEKPSLYVIHRGESNTWEISRKVSGDAVPTPHAALNGQSNNLTKATWLMGTHLEHEFGAELKEFTLFHNPSRGGMLDTWESVRDKFGFTTALTRQFAKILEKAQQKRENTNWVVHSQGGLIFCEAVRYLFNGNSSWALNGLRLNGINASDKTGFLDKQRVAFHCNANNNSRSQLLLDRAGIEVLAIRQHDYDIVANVVGGNTLNPRKILGSFLYSNLVFTGSVPQSPHTTVQTQTVWERNMDAGPGKGRNALQEIVHSAAQAVKSTMTLASNYLP